MINKLKTDLGNVKIKKPLKTRIKLIFLYISIGVLITTSAILGILFLTKKPKPTPGPKPHPSININPIPEPSAKPVDESISKLEKAILKLRKAIEDKK